METPAPAYRYTVQEYLSMGYLYLIVLGIVGDVIFYKFLGINILSYANIPDILMVPINTLLQQPAVLATTVVIVGVMYVLYAHILPGFHFRQKDKAWYRKMVRDIEKTEANYIRLQKNSKMLTVLLAFPCMFIGLKVGSGLATQQRITSSRMQPNHAITLHDGTIRQVRIIGQNSSYLFYVEKDKTSIAILPIGGNVALIEKLPVRR